MPDDIFGNASPGEDPFAMDDELFKRTVLRQSGIEAERLAKLREDAERRRLRQEARTAAAREARQVEQSADLARLRSVADAHTPPGAVPDYHQGMYESSSGGIFSVPEPTTPARLYLYLRRCAKDAARTRSAGGSLRVPMFVETFRAHRLASQWMEAAGMPVPQERVAAARRLVAKQRSRSRQADPDADAFIAQDPEAAAVAAGGENPLE